MGYLELRDAMQPMLDEHTELRAYTVKLLTTIRGPLHELGPILARLHELVGAELPRG